MCTIRSKNQFVGKNLDSAVDTGMLFTNKRGLLKQSAVFPPDRPLVWVSSFGSVSFCLSGKEMPVCGMNECGLIVEQATLPCTVYPISEGRPAAGVLEATQFLLDTCADVEQSLAALESIEIVKTSWPVHFSLFDGSGKMAAVEYLQGERTVFRGTTDQARQMNNNRYCHEPVSLDCRSAEEMFALLEEARRADTIWNHVYDLSKRAIYLKRPQDSEPVIIEMGCLDFSPQSADLMIQIIEADTALRPYRMQENRRLVSDFFHHPVISSLLQLADPEEMIDFIADIPEKHDRIKKIVIRFLDGERIKQIPAKETHKRYVLEYLVSKFDTEREYTEAEVNAIIDEWHTFGDYFILRRELIDSGLMKRLPNGSKYWREL